MEYYSTPEALVTYLAKIRGISRQHAHCLLHEMDDEKAQKLIAAMKLDPDYRLFVAGTYSHSPPVGDPGPVPLVLNIRDRLASSASSLRDISSTSNTRCVR